MPNMKYEYKSKRNIPYKKICYKDSVYEISIITPSYNNLCILMENNSLVIFIVKETNEIITGIIKNILGDSVEGFTIDLYDDSQWKLDEIKHLGIIKCLI